MARGIRWYLVGSVVLGVIGGLAGCSGFRGFAEREPWRHEAEVQCINSGAVKEGPGKVRITAIQGPGACGADFPLKVSSLGESMALSYGDELRPPAAIPNAGGPAPPRWPVAQPQPQPQPQPGQGPYPGANPLLQSQPLSLNPPGMNDSTGAAGAPYDFRRPYGVPQPPPTRAPVYSAPLDPGTPANDFSPVPYESRPAMDVPMARPHPVPALGPSRGPQMAASIPPVSVSPAATLACPLVSVLDQWIANAVQPAALRWFGQPVVEIKQISAYSCRGMNGDPNANISEHAFGNALDIAAFTLADGRKITVKTGWHGLPEEQGFLRDVEGAACDQFTTVLAPGSNVYHYDHIHVDLMRRHSGHRACNPAAVSGEEVAARASARYAGHRGEPAVTGSASPRRISPPRRLGSEAYSDERSDRDLPDAVPGDDGED
jgi:hypothetical protein